MLDENDYKYNQHFRHVGTGSLGVPTSTMCRLCDVINYLHEAGEDQAYSKDDMDDFWSFGDCDMGMDLTGMKQATIVSDHKGM
jgi:hypothetical protein